MVWIQLENSQTTYQQWKDLLHVTLKTSYRFVWVNSWIPEWLIYKLQCILPVFEGLVTEEDEEDIFGLIFIPSTWHAYAKLQLHTDSTLASFEALTRPLRITLCYFGGQFSNKFGTRELPKEEEAHKWWEKNGTNKKKPINRWKDTKVKFSLSTYKLHALGDYANTIRWRGTTDSYTTQVVRALSQYSYMSL